MGRLATLALLAACTGVHNGSPPPAPTEPRSTPTPSSSPGAIAAAARTTCVVRGGRVLCFGDPVGTPAYGHHPDASPTPRVIPGVEDVADLALSPDHACARRRSGSVACWGSLDDGTLGTTGPKGGYRERVVAAPEAIADLTARQLAAGIGFSCAIDPGGSVACWGMNDRDSLGHHGAGSLRPVVVAGIHGAVEIQARGSRACARLAAGEVWCWGGDLAAPHPIAELHDAIKLALDDQRTCVLRAGSRIACDRSPAGEEPLDAIEVGFAGNLRCALRASGEVACDDGDPSRATVAAGVHDAVALALGSGHVCALERDGAVLCWGENDAGQTANPFRVTIARPTPIAGIHDAVRVAVTQQSACAVGRGGDVRCWGSTMGGALGIPAGLDRPTAAAVAGVTDATSITGGNGHFCALTRRGTVACWGTNGIRPCPVTGDHDDCPAPAEVAGLRDAIDVSAFREGNCAVRATGVVMCWGNPAELGFELERWTGEPRVKDGVKDAARVFNGYRRICAVRRDGTAACWGDDVTFEASAVRHSSDRIAEIAGVHDLVAIGRGQPDHALSRGFELRAFDWGNSFVHGGTKLAIAPPLPKVIVSDVARMAQGFGETCAVRRSGSVVCWSIPETPAPVGIDDAIDVAVSENGTRCVVRTTGEVACWGENEHGQCGVDPGTYVDRPREVHGL